MSTTASEGRTPTLSAVISGAVVMAVMMVMGVGWLMSILAGLVTISVVFTLRKRSAPAPKPQAQPRAAAPSVVDRAPAPAAPEEAERSFPDIRVVGASTPTPEPATQPIIASSQMPGETELANRKGGWRYQAPAPLEDIAQVAKVAVKQALVTSSQMAGEVELAGRKGSWTYTG